VLLRGFASKVRHLAWIGSVPPAVAGGYVVDALDLLLFCEPDPLPTRYRRWYWPDPSMFLDFWGIYEASLDVKNFLSRPRAWRRSAWCCDGVWFVLWHETVSLVLPQL